MNYCNLRGFLLVSGDYLSVLKNCNSSVTRGDDGFCFFFNEHFDVFQNAKINVGNEKEYKVFLRNDKEGVDLYVGTTAYIIFPNSCLPLSYPFFSFMMKGSYLFIETGQDYPVITVSYEGCVLSKDFKKKIIEDEKKSFVYNVHYNFQKDNFYSYEGNSFHAPINALISYSPLDASHRQSE